jgi:hypothetical protein
MSEAGELIGGLDASNLTLVAYSRAVCQKQTDKREIIQVGSNPPRIIKEKPSFTIGPGNSAVRATTHIWEFKLAVAAGRALNRGRIRKLRLYAAQRTDGFALLRLIFLQSYCDDQNKLRAIRRNL